MRIAFIERADKEYRSLPPPLQVQAKKQLTLLRTNLRHPSIRAKKYDERTNVWQGRINNDYRFYFLIQGDTYLILGITKHPK